MQAMYPETSVEEKDTGFYAALGVLLHGAGGDQAAMRKGMARHEGRRYSLWCCGNFKRTTELLKKVLKYKGEFYHEKI